LQKTGLKIGESLWDWSGLETAEDLEKLAQLLCGVKDSEGNHGFINAVFIMANPDLAAMQAEGYSHLRVIPITEGFPAVFGQASLLQQYQTLVKEKVFFPVLHGFTHCNTTELLALVRSDKEGIARRLHQYGIASLASLTPGCNFALAKHENGKDFFLPRDLQREWINEGVKLFCSTFGQKPYSTCAPGYRYNPVSCELWAEAEIKVVHTAEPIHGDHDGLWHVARNVFFEPTLTENALKGALLQAEQAVARGDPIVICSHAINYISKHKNRAEHGLAMLKMLLIELIARYPNLRFANDEQLHRSWLQGDSAWWRQPTTKEYAARVVSLWR
jgi:hypothetical protein